MFGDAIVDHEKIAINNAFDPDQFIHMGVLPPVQTSTSTNWPLNVTCW